MGAALLYFGLLPNISLPLLDKVLVTQLQDLRTAQADFPQINNLDFFLSAVSFPLR